MRLGKKLISLCFVLIAAISLSICTPIIAHAATGRVTAKVLNVRSAPSKTSKKVGSIKKGTSVTITSTSKPGWYKISHKGRTGYVSSKFVKKAS